MVPESDGSAVAGLDEIRAAVAGQLASAIDQANSGGANVANSGVIERLTITLGAQPDVAPISVFVVCSSDDAGFVETEILPALDALPLRIRYAVNTADDPGIWDPIYRAMDRAGLLLVAAASTAAFRNRFVRDQTAYWLDSHPDTASIVVVSGQAIRPYLIDERLNRHPVVNWPGAGQLVRAVRHATPATPLAEAGPDTDELRSLAPVRAAYLRWLRHRHATLEAGIAGRTVERPLSGCPMPGNLISDESHTRSRVAELAHLSARAGGDDSHESATLEVLADRPLPTYLGAAAHLDHLDLTGRPVTSPERLLAEVWRAVVLGDPGSGKSSLVRRWVSDLAAADGPNGATGRRLPVLCRAADLITALSAETLSAEGLAAAAISQGWAGQAAFDPDSGDPIRQADLARLARAAVRDRQMMLVVDGLDEVPTQAERRQVAAAIDHFAASGGARLDRPERAPGNQMVVTSRIAGYHSSPLGDRFEQFLIGPLEPVAATAIVDYWLTEPPDVPAAGALPGDAATQRARLIDLVGRPSLPVGEFASNPYLLVSLISASFAGWGSGRKPDGRRWVRADLYRLMVDDAVERGLRRYPGVGAAFATGLQNALAHRIHQRSRSGVIERDLLDLLIGEVTAELAESARSWSVPAARQLVTDLGLLIDRGQGLFGFRHLTVEEYLAAQWVIQREPGASAVANSLTAHLADPRWADVLRLALGELSSTDHTGFDAVVRTMLQSPAGQRTAELVTACLPDLVTLTPQNVESIVAIAVAKEKTRQSSALSTDAALIAPLLGWTASIDGRSCAVVVHRALIRGVTDRDPGTAAAAARLIDAAQIVNRGVAEALFDVQQNDGPEYDWQLTRTLLSMQARRVDDDAPSALLPELADADREWLAAQEFTLPSAEAPRRRSPLRGTGGLERRLAMRIALEREPALTERILADPVWTRAIICLYGGIAFLDARRWGQVHRDVTAAFGAPMATPTERRRLAVLLDTVVTPTLAGREDDSVLFSVAHITDDSPLTARLIALLRDQTKGAGLIRALARWSGDAGLSTAERGDAMAALLVVNPGRADSAAENHGDPVRGRAGWRLGRAEVLFADAVARLTPSAVAESARFDSGDIGGDVIRAMHWLGHHPHRWGGDPPARLDHFIGLAICNTNTEKTYNLAVTLDAFGRVLGGDPDRLVEWLSRRHLSPAFAGQPCVDWPIDPFAPVTADPGEALSALWEIDPRLAFVRCWLLDRLAGVIVAAGHAAEALLCAAELIGADEVSALRTILRLHRAHRQHAAEAEAEAEDLDPDADPADADALLPAFTDQGSAYARVRLGLRRASRTGHRWEIEHLTGFLAPIGDPWYRVRALELAVELRLAEPTPALLRVATETARLIGASIERARALARLSRWASGQIAEDLRIEAVTTTRAAHATDAAGLLAALSPTIVSAAGEATWRTHAAALPEPWQRSLASTDVTSLLLRHEIDNAPVAGTPGDGPAAGLLQWAVMSGATLCRNGIDSLRQMGRTVLSETEAWQALADPARRDVALAVLREIVARRSGSTPIQLTDRAAAGIDVLIDGTFVDAAGELLISCAFAGRSERLFEWRQKAGLLGDVATVLLIESGQLDSTSVGRLESLLTHRDDRLRLRLRLALAPINNGVSGGPGLRAGALGPETLAGFVRLTTDLSHRLPQFSTDMAWATSEIVMDSMEVLIATLEALSGDEPSRQRLLHNLSRPTTQVLDRIDELLAVLSGDDICELLYALQAAGAYPGRFGVRPEHLRRVVPAVQDLLRTADVAVARDCLRFLGQVLPVESASVRLMLDEALADDEVAEAACEAVGFIVARRSGAGDWKFAEQDHEDLMWLVNGPETGAAAAALNALALGGMTIESLDHLPAYMITLGLMATVDAYLVGDRYQRAVQRICGQVLADSFRDDDSRSLVEHLADDVAVFLAERVEICRRRLRPDPRTAWRTIRPQNVPLQVLAEIAQRQPAAVREAVRLRAPHLPGLLVDVAEIDPQWTTRLAAGVLLLCLGRGDGPRLRAVVGLARDSSMVHQAALYAVQWLDEVTDDGVAALAAAVRSDFLTEAHLAVELLGSVARHTNLAPDRRDAVLGALAAAARRPDADRHIHLIHEGRVESIGVFSEACRRSLSAVGDAQGPVVAGAHTPHVLIHLRAARGRPVSLALTAGVPTGEPVKYQTEYLRGTKQIELASDDLDRLNRIGGVLAAAGSPLARVLRELQP